MPQWIELYNNLNLFNDQAIYLRKIEYLMPNFYTHKKLLKMVSHTTVKLYLIDPTSCSDIEWVNLIETVITSLKRGEKGVDKKSREAKTFLLFLNYLMCNKTGMTNSAPSGFTLKVKILSSLLRLKVPSQLLKFY